jgi:hypothetical protein
MKLYPLYGRLGGPRGRSERMRKISLSLEFDPLTLQPLKSRYTDCIIPAPFRRSVQSNSVILWKFCSFAVCDLVSSTNGSTYCCLSGLSYYAFLTLGEHIFMFVCSDTKKVITSRRRMSTSASKAFDYVFTFVARHSL